MTAAGLDRRTLGWFAAPGEYPTTEHVLLDISPIAVDFFEGAPTYLERYLPFWVASPLERFYLLILPLIVLIYPLVRSSPAVYGGFMRRRINRWYKSVREVELGMEDYSLDELTEQIERLSHLSVQLAHAINVPTGYMERYYNLRLHIRLVLDDLRDRRQEMLGEATDQAQ